MGDQVLELGGQSTASMSHYEATSILRSSKDKIQLRVAENIASKWFDMTLPDGLYLE